MPSKLYYSDILNSPVIEEGVGRPITTVKDVIMDADKGKLEALVVDKSHKVISMFDVLNLHKIVIIKSYDSILPASELVRVNDLLKKGNRIIKKKVYDQKGNYLGKVIDFSIHISSNLLVDIVVAKGFINLFQIDKRIISSKAIQKIENKKILVKINYKRKNKEKNKVKLTLKDATSG